MAKSFIHELETLADEVELAWQKEGHDLSAFPQIATRLLQKKQFHKTFNYSEFVKAFATASYQKQHFPINQFSEFSLTCVRREKFFIDVYSWINANTCLHNHHFCGAFQVLQGKSHQNVYGFRSKRKHESWLEEGEITLLKSSPLKTGDVQSIDLLDHFLHQVVHLDKPTVSLSLRTLDVNNHKGSEYFHSGLKIENYTYLDKELKTMKFILLLYQIQNGSALKRQVSALLDTFNDHALFFLFFEAERQIYAAHVPFMKDFESYLLKRFKRSDLIKRVITLYKEHATINKKLTTILK